MYAEGLRFGVADGYARAVMPTFMETAEREAGVAPLVQVQAQPLLREAFEQGQFDAALITRCPPVAEGRYIASEQMVWAGHPEFRPPSGQPLPLAVAPQGCPYRAIAVKALQTANVPWNIVDTGDKDSALEQAAYERQAVMVIPEPRIGRGLVDVGETLGLPTLGQADLELRICALTIDRFGSEFEDVLVRRLARAPSGS